jgi:hypothetical protein
MNIFPHRSVQRRPIGVIRGDRFDYGALRFLSASSGGAIDRIAG